MQPPTKLQSLVEGGDFVTRRRTFVELLEGVFISSSRHLRSDLARNFSALEVVISDGLRSVCN